MLGLRPGCTNRFDIHIIAGVQLRVESWVRRALDEAARHRAVLALHASRIERRPDHLVAQTPHRTERSVRASVAGLDEGVGRDPGETVGAVESHHITVSAVFSPCSCP